MNTSPERHRNIQYGTLFVIWAINFDGSLINMPVVVQHTEITLSTRSEFNARHRDASQLSGQRGGCALSWPAI